MKRNYFVITLPSCSEKVPLTTIRAPPIPFALQPILAPKANVYNCYGMTETSGILFCGLNNSTAPLVGCSYRPGGCIQARIIDTDSGKEIMEPHIKGELWLRGPSIFVTKSTMVMGRTCYPNHCVHWYMSELTSRIVADSGIPSDRHHMGKIVLQSLRDAQDYEFQIDGATGERESSGSVLARSVRCARALTRSGLRAGDVIALMAPNHVHLAIPFYAALYLGIAVACVDRTFGIKELKKSFAKTQPKIVFCQNEKATGVKLVLKELSLDCQIVTFDKGENLYFGELLGNYGNDIEIEDFKPTDFDPEKTLAILIPTTGTTGGLKWASLSHRNLAVTGPYLLWERHTNLASPSRMCLTMSQIQWITEIIYLISTPIFKTPLIMTSNDSMPMDHVVELIRTHKPTFTILSPTQAASIMKHENCDLTCFELIWVGGSVVSEDIINKLKIRAPNAHVCNVYGMTETGGLVFCSDITIPLGSSGKLVGFLEAQIVETDTHKEILEPYAKGELWVKGPAVFVGYYNDPEDTKETMTEDGWFKTGDMFYRDENWNYFFVDRIKLMLYYKKYQITPAELEAGIREHPRVFDVAISSIPDFLWGDLPIACVVLKEGNKTIEQEIKDLVKESLFDSKQLPGGVVFMQRLPLTSSATLDRWKLKEMVQRMDKEAILIS